MVGDITGQLSGLLSTCLLGCSTQPLKQHVKTLELRMLELQLAGSNTVGTGETHALRFVQYYADRDSVIFGCPSCCLCVTSMNCQHQPVLGQTVAQSIMQLQPHPDPTTPTHTTTVQHLLAIVASTIACRCTGGEDVPGSKPALLPPELPAGFLSWIKPVWCYSESDVIDLCGLDVAAFFRMLHLGERYGLHNMRLKRCFTPLVVSIQANVNLCVCMCLKYACVVPLHIVQVGEDEVCCMQCAHLQCVHGTEWTAVGRLTMGECTDVQEHVGLNVPDGCDSLHATGLPPPRPQVAAAAAAASLQV